METIFERATRRAGTPRQRELTGELTVVVVHGAGNSFSAAARLAEPFAVQNADLVVGTQGRDGETIGWVLKDRFGPLTGGRMVREQDPCPCQNGRRFGACHGR